ARTERQPPGAGVRAASVPAGSALAGRSVQPAPVRQVAARAAPRPALRQAPALRREPGLSLEAVLSRERGLSLEAELSRERGLSSALQSWAAAHCQIVCAVLPQSLPIPLGPEDVRA